MKTISRIIALFIIPISVNANGIPIVFQIPPDHNPSNVFVNFVTVNTDCSGMYRDAAGNPHALIRNVNYSIAQLTSPYSVGGGAPGNMPAVLISSFISGRIYFNYGSTGLVNLLQ
jgi:hypothetical protein